MKQIFVRIVTKHHFMKVNILFLSFPLQFILPSRFFRLWMLLLHSVSLATVAVWLGNRHFLLNVISSNPKDAAGKGSCWLSLDQPSLTCALSVSVCFLPPFRFLFERKADHRVLSCLFEFTRLRVAVERFESVPLGRLWLASVNEAQIQTVSSTSLAKWPTASAILKVKFQTKAQPVVWPARRAEPE